MKPLRALVVCLALAAAAACDGSDVTSPEAPSVPTSPYFDGGNGYAGSGG